MTSNYARGYDEYDSDFSDEDGDSENIAKKERRKEDEDLLRKPFEKGRQGKVAHRQVAEQEWDREEARAQRFHLISMDAFARHQKFVNDYILYYGGKLQDFQLPKGNRKTDLDVIRENHRFLWQEEDEGDMTWEKRIAKKYYDKLFKEYCIADLSRYKENKFGFRWRVEKEVVSGKDLESVKIALATLNGRKGKTRTSKSDVPQRTTSTGQFFCGNKRCDEKEGLKSWEVNFGYVEHGEKRNAFVKLRLCPECSYKLNSHHRRKEVQPTSRKRKKSEETGEPSSKKSKRSRKKRKDTATSSSKHEDSSGSDTDDKEDDVDDDGGASNEIWKGPQQETDEKTREEEFDEYFQDMFL